MATGEWMIPEVPDRVFLRMLCWAFGTGLLTFGICALQTSYVGRLVVLTLWMGLFFCGLPFVLRLTRSTAR